MAGATQVTLSSATPMPKRLAEVLRGIAEGREVERREYDQEPDRSSMSSGSMMSGRQSAVRIQAQRKATNSRSDLRPAELFPR